MIQQHYCKEKVVAGHSINLYRMAELLVFTSLLFQVEAPQTLKDRMISTLVSKPKAVCYEEAIPIVESEITA